MVQVYGAPERLQVSARETRVSRVELSWDAVPGAIIPPSAAQEISSDDDPNHMFKGWRAGVYDGQGLVCQSSLTRRHWTRVSVAFEADDVRALDRHYIGGEAVYCGLLFHHFGHFLLESTNRLWWPLSEAFEGTLVFQNTQPGKPIPDFAFRFFRLLGVAERVLVAEDPLTFDRVIVPQSSFVIQSTAHPSFRLPFAKAGEAAERQFSWRRLRNAPEPAGLYLSRTRYSKRRTWGEWHVEQAFAEQGFCILHMEELPLEQQILAARRFSTIAGIAGSAFHNILFSSESKNCFYICKNYNINANFFIVDELMNNRSSYIYNGCAAEAEAELPHRELVDMYLDDQRLDLRKVSLYLMRIGLLPGPC